MNPRRCDDLIENALGNAVRDALVKNKQAGNPVCERRDGKVVWVQPEDINFDDFDNPPPTVDHNG